MCGAPEFSSYRWLIFLYCSILELGSKFCFVVMIVAVHMRLFQTPKCPCSLQIVPQFYLMACLQFFKLQFMVGKLVAVCPELVLHSLVQHNV